MGGVTAGIPRVIGVTLEMLNNAIASSESETQASIVATLASYSPTASYAPIAFSGSASDLGTGVLPNARLSPQVVRNDLSHIDPTWLTINWEKVSNKPATFAPAPHLHAVADVNGLQAALDNRVVGPASSIPNAVPVYAEATGKVLKNSLASIDSGGNVSATGIKTSGPGLSISSLGIQEWLIYKLESSDRRLFFRDMVNARPFLTFFPEVDTSNSIADLAANLRLQGYIQVGSGPRIKQTSGVFNLRNSADSADAGLTAGSATFSGLVGTPPSHAWSFSLTASGGHGEFWLGSASQANKFRINSDTSSWYLGSVDNTPVQLRVNGTNRLSLPTAGGASLAGDLVTTGSGKFAGVFELSNSQTRTFTPTLEAVMHSMRSRHMGAGGLYSENQIFSVAVAQTADAATVALFNGQFAQASGTSRGLHINNTYTQTGTASSVDLYINRVETSLGSGSHNLIDARMGGAARFSVDRSGSVSIAGKITAQGGYHDFAGLQVMPSGSANVVAGTPGRLTVAGSNSELRIYDRDWASTGAAWLAYCANGTINWHRSGVDILKLSMNGAMTLDGSLYLTKSSGIGNVYGPTGQILVGEDSSAFYIATGATNPYKNLLIGSSNTTELHLRGFSVVVSGNLRTAGYVSSGFQSIAGDPTTLDLSAGLSRLVKNTTSGELRHWINDAGVLKKSPAYT